MLITGDQSDGSCFKKWSCYSASVLISRYLHNYPVLHAAWAAVEEASHKRAEEEVEEEEEEEEKWRSRWKILAFHQFIRFHVEEHGAREKIASK